VNSDESQVLGTDRSKRVRRLGRHDQEVPSHRIDLPVVDLEAATARQDDECLRVRMAVQCGTVAGGVIHDETGDR
jgi:protein subunit release factor A